MVKQLAHIALFIALIGQFILTPAMAMPRYLHASSHISQHQGMAQHHKQTSHSLESNHAHHHSAKLQTSDSMAVNCASDMPNLNLGKVDCDALCEILGAGNCVSHCISAPAIIDQQQIAVTQPASTASMPTAFWSLQTVELSSVNPPPIRL